jgi:hypothetical protein
MTFIKRLAGITSALAAALLPLDSFAICVQRCDANGDPTTQCGAITPDFMNRTTAPPCKPDPNWAGNSNSNPSGTCYCSAPSYTFGSGPNATSLPDIFKGNHTYCFQDSGASDGSPGTWHPCETPPASASSAAASGTASPHAETLGLTFTFSSASDCTTKLETVPNATIEIPNGMTAPDYCARLFPSGVQNKVVTNTFTAVFTFADESSCVEELTTGLVPVGAVVVFPTAGDTAANYCSMLFTSKPATPPPSSPTSPSPGPASGVCKAGSYTFDLITSSSANEYWGDPSDSVVVNIKAVNADGSFTASVAGKVTASPVTGSCKDGIFTLQAAGDLGGASGTFGGPKAVVHTNLNGAGPTRQSNGMLVTFTFGANANAKTAAYVGLDLGGGN